MTTILRRWLVLVVVATLALTAGAQSLDDMAKRVETEIEAASKAASDLAATRKTADWTVDASLANRKSSADAHLAEARVRLATGRTMQDPLEMTRAYALASRATQEYQALLGDVRKWKPPVSNPITPPTETTATRTPPPAPTPSPKTSSSSRPTTSIPKAKESPGPKAKEPPGPKDPPADLYAAATAYLSGDYKTTISLLDHPSYEDDRTMAHALLLRSAAEYALYFLGGEKDASLIRSAGHDAAECKTRDSALTPSDRIFSPRYREFFSKAGGSGGPTS